MLLRQICFSSFFLQMSRGRLLAHQLAGRGQQTPKDLVRPNLYVRREPGVCSKPSDQTAGKTVSIVYSEVLKKKKTEEHKNLIKLKSNTRQAELLPCRRC